MLKGVRLVSDFTSDRQIHQDEEEHLQDSFIMSFIVGAIILAIWLSVLFVYINRL